MSLLSLAAIRPKSDRHYRGLVSLCRIPEGMAGTYSFKIDTRRDLVCMELHGFFTPDQMAGFDKARREAYAQLRCAPNQHVTLVDMRGTLIQSQDIVDAFARSPDAIPRPIERGREP